MGELGKILAMVLRASFRGRSAEASRTARVQKANSSRFTSLFPTIHIVLTRPTRHHLSKGQFLSTRLQLRVRLEVSSTTMMVMSSG